MASFNLQTFVRTIADGATAKIAVVGDFLYIQEASAPMLYRFRDEQGRENSVSMVKGDAQRADDPFVEVEITNNSGSDQEVTLLGGRGSFERQPATAQVFTSTPTDGGASNSIETIPANPSRKGVFVQSKVENSFPDSHTGGHLVYPDNVSPLARPLQLLPGESCFVAGTEQMQIARIGLFVATTYAWWEVA